MDSEDELQDDDLILKNITLRNYQVRLSEEARNGNTIIYLPTGSGKTVIAVNVLCSKAKEIIKSFNEGGKRAFFLATTKVLVHQLFCTLRSHTNFKIAYFTGDMNTDTWNRKIWTTQFQNYQVLILTGEIFRQIITLEYISPTNISLIVFDECHNATAEHPYNLILQAIHSVDSSEAPLLLGLTSVLFKSTPKKENLLSLLKALENSFRGKIVTEAKVQELLGFSTNPDEKRVIYTENPATPILQTVFELFSNVCEVIGKLSLKTPENSLPEGGIEFKNRNKGNRIKNALVVSKEHFKELGLFAGSLSALLFIYVFEKYRVMSTDPKEIQTLIYARTELIKIRRIVLKEMGETETADSVMKFSSPKLRQLLHIIKDSNLAFGRKQVSTIIFVQKRATAIILAFLLNKLSVIDQDFSFIKADFFVGSPIVESGSYFVENRNRDITQLFSCKALNTLIATNILEEGVDFTACNIVISFDFPLGYSSYFQSRGRARGQNSFYYVFFEDREAEDKSLALKNFSEIETELHKTVIECNESMEEDSLLAVETMQISGKTRMITADGLTAIKVVHRYCMMLPQDKYSLLSPLCWYTKQPSGLKVGFLQLPVNCPLVDTIVGEMRPSVKSAKRNVFLHTLKKLYDIGEIDEDFNPISSKIRVKSFENLFPNFKNENINPDLPQPGTRKRKQVYKVKFSESLSNCLPQAGKKAFLHVMDLTVVGDKPTLQRKIALYDILKLPVTFAMISSKKLDKIFRFPVFVNFCQINCDLLVNYDEIILTETEINDIKTCHFALFQKVMGILKNSQIFDNRNKEHSFFIAPVEKNDAGRFVLSWDVIRSDYCRNSQGALVRYNPTSNRTANLIGHKDINLKTKFYSKGEVTSKSVVPVSSINGQLLWGVNQDERSGEPEFIVSETDYKHFIIMPNYRYQDPTTRYIVSKFCHDLTPLSPFPRTEYEDYVSYYLDKYSIQITNTRQPLLKVSPLFGCSNYSKPRNRKSRNDLKTAYSMIMKEFYILQERYEKYEELLVPELCDVIPFSRKFYLKALLIPTVLNRIFHVYCVDEFRRKIVSETGLGFYKLEEGTDWKPLEVEQALNEDEEEVGIGSQGDVTKLETTLPLSHLKNASQPIPNYLLNPARYLNDISPCDLKLFVKFMESGCNYSDIPDFLVKQNEEVIKLMESSIVSGPTLKILQGLNDKSGPDLALLVQACTAKSAHDIVDYERLEILGDSFLKFASTLFLFKNYKDNEGVLTILKGKLVGNRNLMYCGLAKNIQEIINVTDFVPLSDWNPPLICIPERLVEAIINSNVDPAVLYGFEFPLEEQFSGDLSEETLRQNEKIIEGYGECLEMPRNSLLPYTAIEDKTVSDCVEAIVGAYLVRLGLPGAFKFLSWLKILPEPQGTYSELMKKPYNPCLLSSGDAGVLNILEGILYSNLERILKYEFKNKSFLLEALTHPSFCHNRVTNCYQRLEFLGDAILDFLITIYVYENCGNLTPGQVTDIRSSLVNNTTFACLVVRYEFHKYLLSFSAPLKKSIENFVKFQVERNHVIDENVVILMEENDCFLAETVQVPKALGDIFESLAGAIFLDSGNSLETVWNVYYRLMKHVLDEFTKNVPKTAVRLLQEVCSDKPYYETKMIRGVMKVTCSIYYKNQEIKAHGFGVNKQEGKRSASKACLKKILQMKK